MAEAVIESGFARVGAGTWLAGPGQPAAFLGSATVKGLKGFIVPDRASVLKVELSGADRAARDPYPAEAPTGDEAHNSSDGGGTDAPRTLQACFSRADAPFLSRLDALPDEPLKVVSPKILLAPFESRVDAKSLKLVPFSFQRALPITHFKFGWVITATRSRTIRLSIEEGETLSVRPEALVAWIGKDPTGFCPKLSFWDMLLPRGPKNLVFSFHGPCVVWVEGADHLAGSPSRVSGRRGWGLRGGRA